MISIIVPVYNIKRIERKFKSAVSSVLNQTYNDFELIIVNDGSTDNTIETLNALQQSDKRIKVVQKENGGVESSRRVGLMHTKGDYILHMDQDDLYRRDAFEIFVNQMQTTNADVVVANHTRFYFSSSFSFGKCMAESMKSEKVIDHETFMRKYYVSFFGMNDLPVNIWNKMYRKEFLDNIPIPPRTGCIIEDLSYNMHVLPLAKKIAVIPDVLYYYRWGGFTNRYDRTVLDTALVGYRLKMKQIEKYHLNHFKAYTAVELINYLNTYFYQIVEYGKLDKDSFKVEAGRVLNLSEVQEGLSIVETYKKYKREFLDAMSKGDVDKLYNYESEMKKKNWKRILIKKLLLKG